MGKPDCASYQCRCENSATAYDLERAAHETMNRWIFAAVTLLELVSITVFCVLGCASKPEPKASTYQIQYGHRVDLGTQCAPLPEVVP